MSKHLAAGDRIASMAISLYVMQDIRGKSAIDRETGMSHASVLKSVGNLVAHTDQRGAQLRFHGVSAFSE